MKIILFLIAILPVYCSASDPSIIVVGVQYDVAHRPRQASISVDDHDYIVLLPFNLSADRIKEYIKAKAESFRALGYAVEGAPGAPAVDLSALVGKDIAQ